MSILFSKESNNNGFALVELAVVMSIIGIFSAVGIPLYTQARNNAIIEGAKQVLFSMKKSCESNYAYGIPSDFSQLRINKYTIAPSSNDCSLIGAIADDNYKFPSFTYDINEGTFSCFFKDEEATPFPECKKSGKNSIALNPFKNNSDNEKNSKSQQNIDLIKKKAEEEAIAKKKAEEEAIAKKKAEEEAIAKSKRDEELNSICGTQDDYQYVLSLKKSVQNINLDNKFRGSGAGNRLGNLQFISNSLSNKMKDCRESLNIRYKSRVGLLEQLDRKNKEIKNLELAIEKAKINESLPKDNTSLDPCSAEAREMRRKAGISNSRSALWAKRCGTSQLRIELNPSIKLGFQLSKLKEESARINYQINQQNPGYKYRIDEFKRNARDLLYMDEKARAMCKTYPLHPNCSGPEIKIEGVNLLPYQKNDIKYEKMKYGWD